MTRIPIPSLINFAIFINGRLSFQSYFFSKAISYVDVDGPVQTSQICLLSGRFITLCLTKFGITRTGVTRSSYNRRPQPDGVDSPPNDTSSSRVLTAHCVPLPE